jgi:hypothetical protein
MSFGTTPRGFMGKREPQTILKTDECRIHLELGRKRKLTATSSGWDEGWLFLQGDKLEGRSQERPLGADPPPGGARPVDANLFSVEPAVLVVNAWP